MSNWDYLMLKFQSVYAGVPVRRWLALGWFAYVELDHDGRRTARVSTW